MPEVALMSFGMWRISSLCTSTYLFRQRLCSLLMALQRFINFVLLLLLLL